MRRTAAAAVLVFGLVASGCGGSELGVGIPECEDIPRDPTTALVLSAQAVPSAEYAPCIDEVELGWDVRFHAERGRAWTTISRVDRAFLTVTLTASCDTTGAVPARSGLPDIEKFEDVQAVEANLRVPIVAVGSRAAIHARGIAIRHDGVQINDRRLVFSVDDEDSLPVRARVERALVEHEAVWVVGDIDVQEGTVDVRFPPTGEGASGVSIDEAFDLMEDRARDVEYRGHWFFTFVGGCVTYEFDTKHRLAETIADDAAGNLGFYPLDDLRELAREMGVEIEQAPPPEA